MIIYIEIVLWFVVFFCDRNVVVISFLVSVSESKEFFGVLEEGSWIFWIRLFENDGCGGYSSGCFFSEVRFWVVWVNFICFVWGGYVFWLYLVVVIVVVVIDFVL